MTRFIWQGMRISFFTAFIFSYYACGLQAPIEVTRDKGLHIKHIQWKLLQVETSTHGSL